jgi:hypothetical protein
VESLAARSLYRVNRNNYQLVYKKLKKFKQTVCLISLFPHFSSSIFNKKNRRLEKKHILSTERQICTVHTESVGPQNIHRLQTETILSTEHDHTRSLHVRPMRARVASAEHSNIRTVLTAHS